jgi:hypothetical protein
MKLKNVINPFGITLSDWKNAAFLEGFFGSLLWYGIAFAVGWGITYMIMV